MSRDALCIRSGMLGCVVIETFGNLHDFYCMCYITILQLPMNIALTKNGICLSELLFCIIYSYILKVPFDDADDRGAAYVWVGNKADPEEARLAEDITDDMYGVCTLCRLQNS